MVCISNLCRVSELAIAHVLVDVSLTASSNSAPYAGRGFVLPLDIPTLGRADIALPSLVNLSVDADFRSVANADGACDYSFGGGNGNSIQVVATHRWPVDGLESSVFTATSLPAILDAIPADSECYYEVYIAPTNSTSGCELPPVLIRDVGVSGNRALTLKWPLYKTLALDVQVQSTSNSGVTNDRCSSDPKCNLNGWRLDVVDPIEGRELATQVTLGLPAGDTKDPTLYHYKTSVNYNPIISADLSPPVGTEIIRLQPPLGIAQPTYYVSMASLSLFSGGGELPVPIGAVPPAISVSGRVETLDQAQAVQAPIALLSTGFSTSNGGIWADYSATTQSDSSGQFSVTVPAGQYRVLVVPPGDGKHAVLDTQWSIQASPSDQAGRLLQVPGYSQIQGRIDASLRMSSSESATIIAVPASALLFDKTSQIVAMRNDYPGTRAASALFQPQSNPQFTLPLDMGRFDVSLRPPEGLPWLVTPGRQVASGTNVLSDWTMPLPVPWSGTLLIPSKDPGASQNPTDLPSAVLRVYALIDDSNAVVSEPSQASAIVQIAEGRTQADASFQLELPDRFQP